MSLELRSAEHLHVVMFPWFAFGHISPFVQLANKLSLHGVRISFLSAPGNIERIKSSLHLTPKAEIIPLPMPHVEGLPPGLESTSEMTLYMAEVLKKALDLMQPQIKSLLSLLKPHFVFFDFAQPWIPKLASELGIKSLHFTVFSAIAMAFAGLTTRTSEEKIPGVEDMMKPPKGFPLNSSITTSIQRFQAEDLTYIFKTFDGGPSVYTRVRECNSSCNAVVMRTCREMEAPYINFCTTEFQKPIFLAGPLVPEPPKGVLDEKWANWLGQFTANSVVFCSFGSETFLNQEQIKELALGLELTGLPFILVLNFPNKLDSQNELNQSLPDGFVKRIHGRGIVHTGWVQQQHILAHVSVGCYLCHSGFSSVIEALVNDCQLVMLPLKGDQFFNSKLLAGDMKAGMEINRRDVDGYFGRDDIFEAVKTIMVDVDKEPGKSIRTNHNTWREFLLNDQIQKQHIAELVRQMRATV